jgi:leucyl/phenylalanyl-tRNA--protein transferase
LTDIYLPCLGTAAQGFPPTDEALPEPNGLLAFGGDLSRERLLDAYRHGIFPWYSDGQPLLWWSPDPRMVLFPDQLHISRSLKKCLDKEYWRITFDTAFDEVIQACAAPRPYADDTWITVPMLDAYRNLHEEGYAHSVEVWNEDGTLSGGLYGIAMGKVFYGESMFSRRSNASKVAMIYLVKLLQKKGYSVIDCQVSSEFLAGLGATEIPRVDFERHLPGTEIPPPDLDWPEECFNSKT